jgi:DNA-binding transcriptional ArsR family regulator
MPVVFDEYDPDDDGFLTIEEGSNAQRILAFLAEHPETGYTPKEIHEATEVSRGSVGATLSRLEDHGLVRHKEPYWAIAEDDRLAAYEGMLHGLAAAEDRLPDEDREKWLANAVDPRERDE